MTPTKENAARLVACWNACHGIEDPADLRRQRDELLHLLDRTRNTISRMQNGEQFDADPIVAAVDHAIAKATGVKL